MKRNVFKTLTNFPKCHKTLYYKNTVNGSYVGTDFAIIKFSDETMSKDNQLAVKRKEMPLEETFNRFIESFEEAKTYYRKHIYKYSPNKSEYNNLVKKVNTVDNRHFELRMDLTNKEGYTLFRYVDIRILKPVIDIVSNGKFENIHFETSPYINRFGPTISIYKDNELVAIVAGIFERGNI